MTRRKHVLPLTYERKLSPMNLGIPCVFQTAEGLCEINDLKPIEGRTAVHGMTEQENTILKLLLSEALHQWRSPAGRAVSDRWVIDYFRKRKARM